MMNHEQKLIDLAKKVKNHVKIVPAKNKGNYFNYIFLCGGEIYHGDNREILSNLLLKRSDVRCLYSENLFTDIDFDLLSFEELLVEYSTNVVVILESYGSSCELGAFSYINKLLKKIIVINNKVYEGKHTFINDGPIKKIKNNCPENVFFEEFHLHPSNPRPTLIISTDLSRRLLNGIPKKRSFKSNSIKIEKNIMIISDILYFQITIFEILSFFGPLNKMEIKKLIEILYEVKELVFTFESNNKISSTLNEEDFNKLFDFLLSIQVRFNILHKDKDRYYIKYSSMINDDLDFLNKNSLLFQSGYLKSKEYLKNKSQAIFLSKKRGFDIWQY